MVITSAFIQLRNRRLVNSGWVHLCGILKRIQVEAIRLTMTKQAKFNCRCAKYTILTIQILTVVVHSTCWSPFSRYRQLYRPSTRSEHMVCAPQWAHGLTCSGTNTGLQTAYLWVAQSSIRLNEIAPITQKTPMWRRTFFFRRCCLLGLWPPSPCF